MSAVMRGRSVQQVACSNRTCFGSRECQGAEDGGVGSGQVVADDEAVRGGRGRLEVRGRQAEHGGGGAEDLARAVRQQHRLRGSPGGVEDQPQPL